MKNGSSIPSSPLSYESLPLPGHFHTFFELFLRRDEKKFLFLIDSSKHSDPWKYILEQIMSSEIPPSECIVWFSTMPRKNPYAYGESDFWNYLSTIVLKREGYFVSRHTLSELGGDIYTYKIPDYARKLTERKLLQGGALVEELEMLEFAEEVSLVFSELDRCELICVEAESTDKRTLDLKSGKNGISQLRKYMYGGRKFYTGGIVAGPFAEPSKPRYNYGLITCDDKGNLIFDPPSDLREPSEDAVTAVKKYLRYVLLRNLSYEEMNRAIGGKPANLPDYFTTVSNLDVDTILDYVVDKLKSLTDN